jgi:heme o synthase
MIGWAAARNDLTAPAWILFAIQFCWQIPHFLAIAWMYRDDYAHAGFAMLPAVDNSGRLTGSVSAAYCVGTALASLLPVAAGWVGVSYGVWALILGVVFTWYAVRFWRSSTLDNSKYLFLASILYLPLLFMLLVRYKGSF